MMYINPWKHAFQKAIVKIGNLQTVNAYCTPG